MGVSQEHLDALYARTDDPWDFRSSPYETRRLAATCAALPGETFVHALELGCGNGELARRIAPRCAAYTGLDAVQTALKAARRAVPGARFVRGFLPCTLPDPGPRGYDLVIVSEVLYFLDAAGLGSLASQLGLRWPNAPVLAVTWLGSTGDQLGGEEALGHFTRAAGREVTAVTRDEGFRIDLLASS